MCQLFDTGFDLLTFEVCIWYPLDADVLNLGHKLWVTRNSLFRNVKRLHRDC